MNRPRFDLGAAVRVVRTVRDDGTYPGAERGELLVRRGSIGYVRSIGTFLQDQVIYSVDFVACGRIVGCREAELIAADDPWVETRFESRERVAARRGLAINGQLVVAPGTIGEVLRVVRDHPPGPAYHVIFPGHTVLVLETSLDDVAEVDGAGAAPAPAVAAQTGGVATSSGDGSCACRGAG